MPRALDRDQFAAVVRRFHRFGEINRVLVRHDFIVGAVKDDRRRQTGSHVVGRRNLFLALAQTAVAVTFVGRIDYGKVKHHHVGLGKNRGVLG